MDIFRRKKFNEAMFAKNRTLAIRVGQYQSSDIKEASFDYGYIKGDAYKPGGTCAGSAKIIFSSIITTFNKLDKIYPEIGLLVDETYEWVKMGEYFINDIEIDRNRKTTKLDLMDGMFKLNREHVTDLTYPAEIRYVIKEICLKTGVKLANENMDITSMNYRIESIPKEKKMTFRDVLSLATQMLGMSCFFNREGKLEIKELTDSGITITADSYFMHGLTKSEVQYQIAGITCKKDKEVLTVGMRTGRSLELDNLFMSQAVLDNLYHKIKDIRYYPFNLNYQGHLLLNVGEWVTIKTNTDETFKSPVLSQSFTFKGGLRGRISADSKAGNDAQYSYAGTITKKIVQFNEFEKQIQNQIEEADKGFDQKVAKIKKDFSDQVELAKAKAEEVKQELSETINQRFDSFDNGPLQEVKRRAEEALKNAGASSLLAQEAKQIGLDSIARLEAFKSQTTSAQTALSGDLDALKRTIANDIRPKQAQAEAEIEKQVKALIQTKNELSGIKSAQATYEETTTRRLSELTNLANGKASKSELTQTAEELASKIASMQVGGRNYIRGTRRMALASGLWTSGTFRPSGVGTAKTIDVSNSPATGFDKAIRLTSSNARDQIGIAQDRFEIMPGTYTISVWVKGSVGQRVKLQTHWEPDDATGISPYFILKDDKWTYLTFSSERKKAGTVSIGYVYLVNADAGEYLDVLAPQLENGGLATSPKEAPEDTDGQISAVESTFKQRADSLEAGVRSLTEGLRTKADISALNVTAENIRQSVKSLETDTQNKLNQKLSQAEFEVRAGSIRQEILNATKDKADKTLVTAEAGKLREEFSKMKVGSRNYAEDYDFSRGLWYYTQGDNSPQDWTISNGEYNVKGTTNTWKQMQIYSKEGSITSGKSSTALLELELGETYTLSFQGICYSGSSSVWLSLRANRTVSDNPEIMHDNFNLTSSWQTYQVTIPALTKPENFDFWRIILGYNEIGHVAFRKVELTRSSTRIDAGPAPEDGKTDLIAAKSTFERTAQGLRTDLSAIQEYVNKDGQRQEALQNYAREESAKQATAVRELVTKDYVGKATYQETVRAIENKFEAITNPQNGSIATQIANYKKSVDGRFADITSMISDKASQADFQQVKETSKLYERILGNTENGIADKVARMAMTNQLFQVEVGKAFAEHQNLFLNSTLTKGFLGNNGIINVANATQKEVTSDFISVDPNEKIIFQHWVTLPENGMAWSAWQFFDKNKNPIDNRKSGLNAYKTTVGKQHNINQITVPANAYFVRFSARMYDDGLIKVEQGSAPSDYSVAPNDALEAVKTVQRQLDGSWSVQNLTSAGSIVSQINATNNQILIEAEKIRLKGKTLLDELTAIQGYFKRLFVGEGTFATLNTDILRANSITADKLVMDMAMARMFVSSDFFTDTLAAKEAFINKLRSVVVSATLLEGYKGWIGGFQIGVHESGSGRWITGRNHFSVGIGNGEGGSNTTALWVNWGNNWNRIGDRAWLVKNNGQMFCYNTAEFWNTPVINGNLRVTGEIYYNNSASGGGSGYWISSPKYSRIEPSGGTLYLYYSGSGYDWIPMNKEISDRRYKSNIQDSPVSALDVIEKLKTYSYRKEYDGKIDNIACGIMAQDVQKYVPEAFYENPDGAYSYRTFELVPYLIKAIQELNQKIEKMEKTIA